ncbi:hypothetical protein GFGA_1c1122 [Gluconobacter frateurii NBRC 103465]|nr:hypothetical protein GFGA_1c1122 [Gluconobacter frateurii NBRC 103465]
MPDWMNEDHLVAEALEVRREIGSASDSDNFYDNQTGASDSPRDLAIESVDSMLNGICVAI